MARGAGGEKAAAGDPQDSGAGDGAPSGALHAPKRDSFLDFLVFLAGQRHAEPDSRLPPPEDLRRFEGCFGAKVHNTGRAAYSRLGIRNDANNCYVNVAVQALLQCSALMWILSKCAQGDPERPFYTCLARICREFHGRKPDAPGAAGQAVNVLALPGVKDMISRWQRLGAQQDAAEFLFHLLGGLHDECKWPASALAPAGGAGSEERAEEEPASEWAHLVKTSQRRAETRAAGLHEDSPVARIFGGLVRSIVRTRGAKADSVSLEPCNHLDLDISQPSVTSVRAALEAFCNPEAVNEGQATRRVQFKALPKVLILNLKRFAYNRGKGGAQKLKKAVKYDEKIVFDRSWLAEGTPPVEYWMTALICHHGDSAHGGHYTAVVRYNTEWYLYDDAVVRQVEPREVAAQQTTAYLLVYQCHGEVDLQP